MQSFCGGRTSKHVNRRSFKVCFLVFILVIAMVL
uniref:Uncharacterized protein n=1 Tax=Arundo donax TaxID=35708 RepID=A0A0A9BD24_ARUDO